MKGWKEKSATVEFEPRTWQDVRKYLHPIAIRIKMQIGSLSLGTKQNISVSTIIIHTFPFDYLAQCTLDYVIQCALAFSEMCGVYPVDSTYSLVLVIAYDKCLRSILPFSLWVSIVSQLKEVDHLNGWFILPKTRRPKPKMIRSQKKTKNTTQIPQVIFVHLSIVLANSPLSNQCKNDHTSLKINIATFENVAVDTAVWIHYAQKLDGHGWTVFNKSLHDLG